MTMNAEQDIQYKTLLRLRSLLDNINNSKVTLIGDIMLDRYYHGFANNLNSTAPVPVIKIIDSYESPGAAAHIALGLNSLGMSIQLFSCVGDDAEGDKILSTLSDEGIDISNIMKIPNRKTLTKIRFYGSRESLLNNSQILLQADREALEPLSMETSDELVARAKLNLDNSSALVISDYDKGVVSTKGAIELIKIKSDAAVAISLALSAFINKSIGLKKITPPIPTTPEINPITPPMKKQIVLGILLKFSFSSS